MGARSAGRFISCCTEGRRCWSLQSMLRGVARGAGA
jgi:hypothetical protein